jgi:hypothetical protein
MGAKQRRIQQMVAAEMRRPSEEFRSELVPVEISLGCRDLPILAATGSCLSVFAVLWIRKQGSERWQEHGRTEVVRSGSAPQFARSFFLDYLDHDDVLRNEEYDTWLRVELFQHTGTTVADLEKQKRCGWVETTLRELYRTPVKQMPIGLRFSRSSAIKQGSLELRIADAPRDALQPFVEFSLAATIGKVGRGAKSPGGSRSAATGEYFVTCHRYTIGGVFELFYRTERARPTVSASAGASVSFDAVKQSLQCCCFGQHDTFLRFEFWQEDKLGFHQKLGSMDTTLAEMMESQSSKRAADNRAAEQQLAQNDAEESAITAEKPGSRKEGRRRRRAATPGSAEVVSAVRYELKPPKTEEAASDAARWMKGSMGALPLDDATAADPLPVLLLHAELFSSTAPDESADGARAGASAKATSSSAKQARKQQKASRKQKAKLARAAGLSSATASAEFGGDLDFLKELLDDAVVSESDVKDIVGDGIRYLHERHQRSSTLNGGPKAVRGGAGNFLDGATGGGAPGLKPPRSTKASQGHTMLLRLAAAEEKANAGSPEVGKRRRRRRPQSSPAAARTGSDTQGGGEPADRPQTEGGGSGGSARLPSIGASHFGMQRHQARAAEAQEKHAQRRVKQAEADDRRSIKLGDRSRFVNALRSEESTRTMTVKAAAALHDDDAEDRFMMQPPAPGVYEAPQPHRAKSRGSVGGGRRGGGRALAERSVNAATIDRLATPQKRSTRRSELREQQEQQEQQRPKGVQRAVAARSRAHGRSQQQQQQPYEDGARGARRAPMIDGDYDDDYADHGDEFGGYSSEEDWENRAAQPFRRGGGGDGGGGGFMPSKLPSTIDMRASAEAEEVEDDFVEGN